MVSATSVAIGTFGSLIAIIILTLCGTHSIYILLNGNNIKMQKQAIKLELLMIISFLFSSILYITLRNNYFRPYHTKNDYKQIECTIVIIFAFPLFIIGKIAMYSVFVHRIYHIFKSSPFAISKKIACFVIISLILTASPGIMIQTVYTIQSGTFLESYDDILICRILSDRDNMSTSMKYATYIAPTLYVVCELFVCIYLLYLFVSRLMMLRSLLLSFNMETKSLSSSSEMVKAKSMSSMDRESVNNNDVIVVPVENNKVVKNLEQKEAMKLKSLTTKQTVLGVTAIISSLFFYGYNIITLSSGIGAYGVMIDTLSVHLMFGHSQKIWDTISCKNKCSK